MMNICLEFIIKPVCYLWWNLFSICHGNHSDENLLNIYDENCSVFMGKPVYYLSWKPVHSDENLLNIYDENLLNIYDENCSVFIIYVWNLFIIHDKTCEVFVMKTCSELTMKYAQTTALSLWKNFDMTEANRQRSVLIWECWKQCHAPSPPPPPPTKPHNNISFTFNSIFSELLAMIWSQQIQ